VRGSLSGGTSLGACVAALSAEAGREAAASPAIATLFITERRPASLSSLPFKHSVPAAFSVISIFLDR
jgi:hypothetical protein